MEVKNHMLEMVKPAQAPQSAQVQQNRDSQATDFDELLQQKRQESAPAARTADKQEVQEKEAPKAAGEKPQAEQEEEIPEDAKAVLAAMMLQPQPEDAAVTVEAPEPEVVTSVEALAAEHAPEAAAAMAEAAPVAVDEKPQASAEAREVPVETEARPQQELQQAEVVERAPETAEAQPQRSETGSRTVVMEPARAGDAPEKAEEERPAEAPVFVPEATAEAVPVKVAEPVLNPEKPVPIESEEAPRDLAEILSQSVEQNNTIGVIRLTPENLGPVTLTLSRAEDGSIHMVLEALNPKTTALLEKHMASIQNIAAENTRQDVRVEIKNEPEQMWRDNWTDDRDGQQRQQEQQKPQQEDETRREDFLHRLRLGLTGDEETT